MLLSAAIQHHPRRAGLLPALLEALDGRAEVVEDPAPLDPFPSPWRTYRHALELSPAGATHRLVLQDDVEVCPGFLPAVEAAIEARPDRLLSFFVAGRPEEHARAVLAACAADLSWAELDASRWCPAIALAWPARLIRPLLEFVDAQNWPPQFRADDEIIGRFLRDAGEVALASVPSLVEHRDVVPSLIGMRAMGGQDAGRVAACFLHPDCGASQIDWALGPGAA